MLVLVMSYVVLKCTQEVYNFAFLFIFCEEVNLLQGIRSDEYGNRFVTFLCVKKC
jgi:hypothetical protein